MVKLKGFLNMNETKLALMGSSGYISSFFLQKFALDPSISKVLKLDQKEIGVGHINLGEPDVFDYSVLSDVDCVIFTAAISSPDQCANDYQNSWKINVVGTSAFIEEALRRGCRVLFFSSDAVFGGSQRDIFYENSCTNAQTAYGKMKKAIEDKFFGNPGFKAIRLSYVVSSRDKFVSYCLNCIRTSGTADVFHPFYRNCISISDVIDSVIWLIKNWDTLQSPCLNVAGSELVSRIRVADEINRIFDGRLKYVISRPDDLFFVNRPAITQMGSIYLDKYDIIKKTNFTEKIQAELKGVKL